MPKFLEDALRASAERRKRQGKLKGDVNSYVYGAMNNLGAMHGNKETPKGAEMERKHQEHQEALHAAVGRRRK